MGMQLPLENAPEQPQQAAEPQNVIADLAGRLWQEMRPVGEAVAGGLGIKDLLNPVAPLNIDKYPLAELGNDTKKYLNTGHVVSRMDGSVSIGTAQFAQNPPLGWHMRFDKVGNITQADGVKEIGSAAGVTTYQATDGSRILVDGQGLLRITNDSNITAFPRVTPENNALPQLMLDGLKGAIEGAGKVLNKLWAPETYITKVDEHGTQTVTTRDGTAVESYKNGVLVVHNEDGRYKISADGILTVVDAKGAIQQYAPQKTAMYKDGGSIGYSYADGTYVVLKHRIAGEKLHDTGIEMTTPTGARVATFSHIPGRVDYTPAPPRKAIQIPEAIKKNN